MIITIFSLSNLDIIENYAYHKLSKEERISVSPGSGDLLVQGKKSILPPFFSFQVCSPWQWCM